ncbi:family 43 glycosylhydrolase [Nocardioides sambongensis]|uniref:family 43 glycosylhydrolase n=1 Tax=Nocardioides sambongensis TaxID=2589074 RepID=UPI001E284DBA|nr:family 43 glycosylhydrolase [Nocardioides sambongensis]
MGPEHRRPGHRGQPLGPPDLDRRGTRGLVRPAGRSGVRRGLGPELARLDGRWHIHFAASDGDNRNHRAFVLVAETDDPLGDYTLHGPMATGDASGGAQWAIDMTVLEHGAGHFAIWSGWPDASDPTQHLYLAAMASPTRLAGPRVRISDADDHPWERIDPDRPGGLNEAPQVVRRDGRTFVLYSASHALHASYRMGLIELVGADPLDPDSWRKHPLPVFEPTPATPGVGHGTVVGAGPESWLVFHRKVDPDTGFRRAVHVEPIEWQEDGWPLLGEPTPTGTPLPQPAGTPRTTVTEQRSWDFPGAPTGRAFDYYGHHQLLAEEPDGLHLGLVPPAPVNAYRSAEKLVLRDGAYSDVAVRATVDVRGRRGTVGLLLRVTAPAVGPAAQRGYLLGYDADSAALVILRTDGRSARLLARRPVPEPPTGRFRLVAVAVGDRLTVSLTSEDRRPAGVPTTLRARDERYRCGSIGVRVDSGHAVVTRLAVEPVAGSAEAGSAAMVDV